MLTDRELLELVDDQIHTQVGDCGIGGYEFHGARGYDSQPCLELISEEVILPRGVTGPEYVRARLVRAGGAWGDDPGVELDLDLALTHRGWVDGQQVYTVEQL